ncbi:MAG: hypothetical protein HC783_18105, partial [Rhodobacteraceae bacterium]|nr:hypothetical protein [Paracoccaceae bacterium]
AKKGAQVICLQELFAAQYFCQEEDFSRHDLAEPVPGPSTDALAPLAKELDVVIVAPVALLNTTRSVSAPSTSVSPRTATVMVLLVCPPRR